MTELGFERSTEGAVGAKTPRLLVLSAAGRLDWLRWLKRGLSVFLFYHLACLLILPNSDNWFWSRYGKWMQPYVNFFEFTNCWNFFSPVPGAPQYVEYELFGERGESLGKGTWPERSSPFFLRERQNRRVTSADFMVGSEARAEKMLVPYLCRSEKRPRSVSLWRVVQTLPAVAEVESGKRSIGDGVGEVRQFVSTTFCGSAMAPGAGV